MSEDVMTSPGVQTIYTDDTEYTADSVEWCPWSEWSHIFLCGTYQLTQGDGPQQDETPGPRGETETSSEKKLRKGRLYAYEVRSDSSSTSTEDVQIKRCHATDVAAILDIKWDYGCHDPCPRFALVDAEGALSLWHLTGPESVSLERQATVPLGQDRLALSLDWASRVQNGATKIAGSDSKGCISLVGLDSGDLEVTSHWKAHDFEAWIVGFNYWNTDILYTGGDDCKLIGWDSRLPTDCPVFTSRKHSAGVCSVQSHPFKENLLATGSYDEHVFVWDTRQMRRPISDTPTGGGVWHVKWDPWNGDCLLVADMYNGFHVLDCTDLAESGQEIVCSYMEHKSIAYGADWCPNRWTVPNTDSTNNSNGQSTEHLEKSSVMIATCSFYDHMLKVWTWSGCKS